MKCSNPNCNRGIGLVGYRNWWFSKQRYCSSNCCDAFVADLAKSQQKRSATSYFELLFFTTDWQFAAEIDARGHPPKPGEKNGSSTIGT
jgi:hypothetical protein